MADAEESPAQRQVRLRREKREAKIKGGAQDRLDKITRLSGRTPESVRNESPAPTPPLATSTPVAPSTPIPMDITDPEQLKLQEEMMRAFLRNPAPQQQQQPPQMPDQEDPMMKMLSSMMGGMNDNPDAAGGLPFNPDDISKATGLPKFVTNMILGKQEVPPTVQQVQETKFWRLIHLLFAVLAGFYLVFMVDKLTSTFGDNPPAPATIQSPFVVFVMGEVLLHSARAFFSTSLGNKGLKFWWQTAKDLGRDGAIMIFMIGMYSWWRGQ